MTLPTTKEIILRLKAEKEKNDYSIPQIQKMCWDNGLFMCLNTVRNIFANGSEDCSFSYEHTLRPIANVLLSGNRDNTSVNEQELELLSNQLQRERELHQRSIDYLNSQIQSQRKTIIEKNEIIKELLANQLTQKAKN